MTFSKQHFLPLFFLFLLPILNASEPKRSYTFLICPNEDVSFKSEPIQRLGNSTTSFFATTPLKLVNSMIPSSCQIFKTLLLPVSSSLAVELNDQDLWLKWDHSPDSVYGRFINNTTFKLKCLKSGLYSFTLLILKLICLSFLITLLVALIICVAYVTFSNDWFPTLIRERSMPWLLAREPCTGHAEYTIIELYKKVELKENMKLPGRNDVICPICLMEYARNETVGCLLGCEHCFHIECIDTWLHLHCSCPICRNKISQQRKTL